MRSARRGIQVSKKLGESEIQAALSGLPTWRLEHGELVQVVTFKDFKEAMKFVTDVADLAEVAGHHPDIDIRYNKVRLGLVTHDAGGITSSDVSLAGDIDKKSQKKPLQD
jgi:4a-hydroxytetrahydrobiopterin dehydratase